MKPRTATPEEEKTFRGKSEEELERIGQETAALASRQLTTLTVQRHYKVGGQEEVLKEESVDTLQVQDFVVTPAKVRVELGVTLNLGNYESARVTVGVDIPCYREEVDDAYAYWMDFVKKKVIDEQAEVKEWALARGVKNNHKF